MRHKGKARSKARHYVDHAVNHTYEGCRYRWKAISKPDTATLQTLASYRILGITYIYFTDASNQIVRKEITNDGVFWNVKEFWLDDLLIHTTDSVVAHNYQRLKEVKNAIS